MYEISVQSQFAAAHAIVMRGVREPLHGHNWHVTVVAKGPELDADGLLCDFHLIEGRLRTWSEQYNNKNLNDTPPFDRINPSAENVARQIGEILVSELRESLAPRAWIDRVTVTEAPGCAATYALPRSG